MLTSKQNPPQRSEGVASVDEIAGDWWIAHTKARNEKALARDLLAMKVPYYLPMVLRETYSGDRRRRNLYPLFTSYLFFAGDKATRLQAFSTHRIASVLEVTDRERFVGELAVIERVLAEDARVELYPGLPVGQRVSVKAGPFKDVEGVVLRSDTWTRIVLQISALGVGAALEINGDLLEVVD